MSRNKTPSRNREDWKRWYNYQNNKGEFPNKRKYLKKKIITRIMKGEKIMLKSLRKYGLLDFYKKNISRNLKRQLKLDLEIEPAILAKPDPYIFPDGTISYLHIIKCQY